MSLAADSEIVWIVFQRLEYRQARGSDVLLLLARQAGAPGFGGILVPAAGVGRFRVTEPQANGFLFPRKAFLVERQPEDVLKQLGQPLARILHKILVARAIEELRRLRLLRQQRLVMRHDVR